LPMLLWITLHSSSITLFVLVSPQSIERIVASTANGIVWRNDQQLTH
jgi:hypothetical protein